MRPDRAKEFSTAPERHRRTVSPDTFRRGSHDGAGDLGLWNETPGRGKQKSGASVEQPAVAVSASRCNSNFEGVIDTEVPSARGRSRFTEGPMCSKETPAEGNTGRGFQSSGLPASSW